MFGIKVLDHNLQLVNIAELEHTKKNIDKLAGRHEIILGKIINKDESSDCITIVTYETGVLGFSI